MERSHVLDAMSQLKLYGMKAAYDEIITTAVKRQHAPQKVVGDLLNAEISEKQARSIKYQMTIAKAPHRAWRRCGLPSSASATRACHLASSARGWAVPSASDSDTIS
jgi:hypothetical protein